MQWGGLRLLRIITIIDFDRTNKINEGDLRNFEAIRTHKGVLE